MLSAGKLVKDSNNWFLVFTSDWIKKRHQFFKPIV